jgi:serine O-acetyltransferase
MIDYEARCASHQHHKWAGVRAAIREDIFRFATFSPEYRPDLSFATRLSIFLKPSILCLFWYRTSHYLHLQRWKRLAGLVSKFNQTVHKANIPPQSCIGPGCFIGHCPGLTFHGSAGRNLTMLSLAICCPREDGFGGLATEGPRMGDNVLVGAHAVVIGPVNVGDEVKVATNTFLNIDCPSNRIACCAKIRHSVRHAPALSEQQCSIANASGQESA